MHLDEQIVVLNHDSRHIGKKCVKCEEEFVENHQLVACPRCRSNHHVDCWKAGGGCGKYGCPQVARAVVDSRPVGDGPVPGVSRKYIFAGIGIGILIILAVFFWPKAPDPAAGRTKITVLIEAYFEEQDKLYQLANDFNDHNEDIYIEVQTTSVSFLEQQLMVRSAAGDAPDIFSLPYDRFEVFLELNALYPLGTEGQPYFGVQHPSKLRTMNVFLATKHPEEAIAVLKYLLSEMPKEDLTEIKEQLDIVVPATVADIDTFLGL